MMRTTSLTAIALLLSMFASAQIFSEDFKSFPDSTDFSTSNTAFTYLRIGSGGGRIQAKANSSLGTGSSMMLGGSTTGSLVGVGVMDSSFAPQKVCTFSMRFSSNAIGSGDLTIALGTGSRFSNNSGYTTSQLLAALQIDNGQPQIRDGSSWVDVDTLLQDGVRYDLQFLINGSSDSVKGGEGYIQAHSADLYLNGKRIAHNYTISANQDFRAFRVYQTRGGMEVEIESLQIIAGLTPPRVLVYNGWWSPPTQASIHHGLRVESDSLVLQQSIELAYLEVDSGAHFIQALGSIRLKDSLRNQGQMVVKPGAFALPDSGLVQSGLTTVEVEAGDTIPGKTHFWGSPVSNPSFQSVFPQPISAYSYDASAITNNDPATGWSISSGSMQTGVGYAVQRTNPPANGITQFTGNLISDHLSIPLKKSALPNAQAHWNSVANPFAAGLDLNTFLNTNSSSISNAIYVWNPTNGNGSYEVFNDADGLVLHKGQGFFVNHSGTGNLHFKLNQRRGSQSPFIRSDSGRGMVYVKMKSGDFYKTIKLQFDSAFSQGYDPGYDVIDLPGENLVNAYSFIPGEKERPLGIQTLGSIEDGMVVPLGVEVKKNALVEFELSQFQGIDEEYEVFLRDQKLGRTHRLGQSNYACFVDTEDHPTKRFQIVLRKQKLGNDPKDRNGIVLEQGADWPSALKGSQLILVDQIGRQLHLDLSLEGSVVSLPTGVYFTQNHTEIQCLIIIK